MLSSIAFSPEEESQVIRRAAAEWVGYKVDTLAVDRVEEYAASVIEPDGSVTVLCAPCNPTDIDHVRRSVEVEEHFVPIDYRDVEYSAEELLTIAETFADKLTRNDISHGGSILSGENRIEIFVSDKDIQRARELEVPPSVSLGGGYEEVEPDVDKDDQIAYLLVEGGQALTGLGGAFTSGFAVESAYGTFILSAGHIGYPNECTFTGDDLFQAGVKLGEMTAACQYGGNADGSLTSTYSFRNNWGRVHYTSTNWQEPVTFGVSSHNLVNQTVCQTGFVTTGMNGNFNITNRCGVVSSTASKSPCGGASPAWTFSLGAANYLRASGDSGAAVLWPTIYGYGAAGTHSCVGFGGTGAIFSRYSVMAANWGLSLSAY
jgi:hypothetical protein